MRLIREATYPGDGILAPGAVVLRDKGADADQRYVVHYRNDQVGGYHMGFYTEDRARADANFEQRVERYRAVERPVGEA